MIKVDRRRSGWLPFAAIIVLSALLVLPAALSGMRTNDSFWIDWVWVDQFADQLSHGVLYPRWLPQSHAGLGSPVFYYYAPIAFYVAAPFKMAGLSVYGSVVAMFFMGYALSGAAMFWWLKDRAPTPLLGALIFVAAPYHAFNFYNRGAMAEFLATAFIPLVMLGIAWVSERRRLGIAVTALSYAALICTHLPLALLASVFLFAPYAVVLIWRDRPVIVPIALGLVLGVMLSAIYLAPALALAPFRDTENLWRRAVLQPQNWTFWHPGEVDPNVFRETMIIVAGLAVPMLGLIIRRRSGWAAAGMVCALIAIGTVPMIWELPVLKSVQFPFRLLPVAEFGLATALAMVPWKETQFVPALIPVVLSGFIVTAPAAPPGISLEELARTHPDVPENLPPGNRPYSWPSRWALNLSAQHHGSSVTNGITTEPVFYFPAWEVRCEGTLVATFPAPTTELLSYRGTGCARTLGLTAPERWGMAISLATLLLLIAGSLAVPRLRRPSLRPIGRAQEVTE